MKKIMVIIIFLVFTAGTGRCFMNEPDGFFIHKWGSTEAEFMKGYTSVRLIKDGEVKWYVPNTGFVQFSGVMTRVTYQFFNGELFFVNIYFEKEKLTDLKNALKATYGEPTNKLNNVLLWEGEATSISLDTKNDLISFWSTKINEQRKQKK